MRERGQRVGAVVQVESAPGQGTRVCIELPSVPTGQGGAIGLAAGNGAGAAPPAEPAHVAARELQEDHTP
jgi:two-component system nitrate/nitrite sensor histidine kinase NarX